MKYILTFGMLCCLLFSAQAQELNCRITVNADQLAAQQKTDFAYFDQLKAFITDMMNNRRWTNDQFTTTERINCSLNINLLKSTSQGVFEGTAQFVITRPVYGTNYETTVFSYVDRNFSFAYLPTQPVYYRDNLYTDELTSILAFYAYVALAVDYDTFSKLGGNPHIQKAYSVMNYAQQGPARSYWGPEGDKRNRYYLIENLQNQQFLAFREGLYTYHRLGLDLFSSNPIEVRKQTLDLLTNIRKLMLQIPNSVLINSFFDAKGDEIINIMYEGTPNERKKAFDLLAQLDPGKTEAYRRLLN
ncbi:type IX secretion system protein PorD [Arsenicibacter rosenii]|uniref:DUF4835 domain-containing protein n=1 Tax=Arsenicibacter rosenii TaxID=1750698 RepID=A0A1S2VFL0_9BACT|nr:DUF4835 family protein [Arsenicibacter rosenii]OIN57513.1 DUF4835 domain-containing protein [Arsenicibacter rosenii]